MSPIVHYSGGVASFIAARRAVERFGPGGVTLLFCDTGEESEGLYEFLGASVAYLRAPLVRLAYPGGMDALIDKEGAIPSTRMAFCTRELKRDLAARWLAEHVPDPLHVLGIEHGEPHRGLNLVARYGSDRVWLPLWDRPHHVLKAQMVAEVEALGLPVSAAYRDGASHDNCGGGCVKAGHRHWAWCHAHRPEVYRRWVEREDRISARRGYPCTILRDRRGGKTVPLSLREFAARLADPWAWLSMPEGDEGCGCYASPAALATPEDVDGGGR